MLKAEALDRPRPYEGSEDYIFISYSHRDSARIFPLLRKMSEQGFRFWYDEGIDPGTEWPESIAMHLEKCRVCLAFLSPTSVTSVNCRREINFALSRNKDFLSVALDPVEMSPGMEMQISTYQSLLSYKYPRWEEFEEKLFSLDILKSCRKKAEEMAAPAPAPAVSAEPAPAVRPAKAAPAAAPSEPARGRAEKPKIAGIPKPLLIGIPVLVVLAVALIVINPFKSKDPGTAPPRTEDTEEETEGSTRKSGRNETEDGEETEEETEAGNTESKREILSRLGIKDETEVGVSGETLGGPEMAAIASLNKCRRLTLRDCVFSEGSFAQITGMTDLTALNVLNGTGITESDLAGFDRMENLTDIQLNGCGLTDEAAGLVMKAPKLRHIYMNDNELTGLPDLGEQEAIEWLYFSGNRITDISGLNTLKAPEKLSQLGLSDNELTYTSGTGAALRTVSKLKALYLDGNSLTELPELEYLIYLEEVTLGGNGLTSLDCLQNCSKLKVLDINGCTEITDISVIGQFAEDLKELGLSGVRAEDWSVLAGCTALQKLNVNSCGLEDLDFCSSMTQLTALNAADNRLTDISGLSHCGALSLMNLAHNELTALEGFPEASSGRTVFTYLLLHDNPLTDLSGVRVHDRVYNFMTLYGTDLTDASGLVSLSGSGTLITEMFPAIEPKDVGFSRIYVVPDVDPSLQAAWESTLGSRIAGYMSVDDAWDQYLSSRNDRFFGDNVDLIR